MKILVLAGGFDQIALIQELKKNENRILLADYYENPPAKKYADQFFRISTLDEKAIYELALHEKVDLITTACTDQALLTVARVSERLKLPCYISAEKALTVTNKYYMKQIFDQNNVRTAKFCVLCESNRTGKQTAEIKKFPVIVKPCDCNSSKGVKKVNDEIELADALHTAYELTRSKKVIVEEYIQGVEISIDAWVNNNKSIILSTSETRKIEENENSFTICSSVYPIVVSDIQKKNIENEVQKITNAFDIENGPLLVQAIITEKDVYIVEFSMRMGGGTKYRLIEYMSHVDIMKKYVEFILTGNVVPMESRKSEKYYELDYLYSNNGIIVEIKGLEKIVRCGYAKEIYTYKEKGCFITNKETSSDRVLGVLIEGKSLKEIKEKQRRILSIIRILNEKGENLLYTKCFEKR